MTLELKRQIIHISLGIGLTTLYAFDIVDWPFFCLVLVIGFIISAIHYHKPIRLVEFFLRNLDRKDSFMPGWGVMTYVFGLLLVTVLFPKTAAMTGMMVLILGDGFSTIVGYHYGSVPLPWSKKKTLEGSFAGFVAALLGTLVFLPFVQAFVASSLGLLVESIPRKYHLFDDNVFVPLAAALSVVLMNIL